MYFLAKISYIFYLLIFLKAVCCSRVISNLALHFIYYFFTIFFCEFSLINTHGCVVIKLNMNIA